MILNWNQWMKVRNTFEPITQRILTMVDLKILAATNISVNLNNWFHTHNVSYWMWTIMRLSKSPTTEFHIPKTLQGTGRVQKVQNSIHQFHLTYFQACSELQLWKHYFTCKGVSTDNKGHVWLIKWYTFSYLKDFLSVEDSSNIIFEISHKLCRNFTRP